MKFCDELKKYMEMLDCTPKDLSESSKLSPTIISRYLNDKRTPRVQSEYFEKIVSGFYIIAVNKRINISKEEIVDTLTKSITSKDIDFNEFANNFNTLLSELKINISDLAKAINYDTSFISRIKNGNRKPADLDMFIEKIADFVTKTYKDNRTIASLLGCSLDDINDENKFKELFVKWLTTASLKNEELVKSFLEKLDTFNLNDYIGKDFNKVKVPTSPVILRTSKTYYGADGRKQAEAEFLKTTLIAKSKEPICIYSNLPISDASNDEEFTDRWVVAMSMVLKKGLHLNIIHDIDRPINEMFLGLENWIPMYMTGSISPYYFKNPPASLFNFSNFISGSCALSGECTLDNLDDSKFYFTTKKEEIEYYKNKSKYLFSKAKPLMTIYKEADKAQFEEFMNTEGNSSDVQKVEKDYFKNIDFYVNKGKWVIVNKKTSPEIHFVIHNPKLRDAIEKFL